MKTRPESLVVFVPGFFGFSQFGRVAYFEHLERPLLARLRRRGLTVRTYVARPDPTGGVRTRAETLLDQVRVELDREPARKVHWVGHSTGGLDLRFALDPRFRLREHILPPTRRNETRDRIRQVLGARVTIATPHRGTSFAVPFALVGPGALESKLPPVVRLVLRLVRLGVKPDSDAKRWLGRVGLSPSMFESIAKELGLHAAPVEDLRRAVEFVLSVIEDRDGIGDLTPTFLRRAARADPSLGADGPHCSSILTFAPAPRLARALTEGDARVFMPQHVAFAVLWALTAYSPCIRDWPEIAPSTWKRLAPPGAPLPDERTNDGIVPTRSQPWGEVVGIFQADHQDVVGQIDCLRPSGSFTRRDLSRLIDILADRINRAERSRGPRPQAPKRAHAHRPKTGGLHLGNSILD